MRGVACTVRAGNGAFSRRWRLADAAAGLPASSPNGRHPARKCSTYQTVFIDTHKAHEDLTIESESEFMASLVAVLLRTQRPAPRNRVHDQCSVFGAEVFSRHVRRQAGQRAAGRLLAEPSAVGKLREPNGERSAH